MWRPTISSDELWHHGILGMQWGHRNGPPYPLDDKDHSSREKKKGWRASLNTISEKRRKKKSIKADARAYRKVARGLKRDKDYQDALAEHIINTRKRQALVKKRSGGDWHQDEDYYAYKDRVRNAWALSKEGALDRKENEALKKRIKAIAQKKLGNRYNDRSLDWVGSSSKSRGDRVVSQLDTLTNYWDPNDYKTTRRYMSNKTRRKIIWNR